PACEDAGLSFTSDITEKTQILADRGLLSQAVSNLVENAIKYTPSGGKIHLSLQKVKHNQVEISISDDGPGIPSFDRERVKERFVRLDKSRTLPGSGLGLALVDAVADLHRAELHMDDGLGDDVDRPGLKISLIFPNAK
ncbi:MAG: sensor histidine kinase, partial [Litorimonas sp.]